MSLMMRPAMLFYDLDGTLVDSLPDIADCLDLALAQVGLEPAGEARVRNWVGNGLTVLIERALQDRCGSAPPMLQKRVTAIWDQLYAVRCCHRTHLYPGAIECLRAAADARMAQAVITNKPVRHAAAILEGLGIYQYFHLVLGGDSLPERKPHPRPLIHARNVLGGGLAWMIGDSVSDVEAARAARIPVICTTYGYNHGVDIRTTRPDRLVDSLIEVPRFWGGAIRPAGR